MPKLGKVERAYSGSKDGDPMVTKLHAFWIEKSARSRAAARWQVLRRQEDPERGPQACNRFTNQC